MKVKQIFGVCVCIVLIYILVGGCIEGYNEVDVTLRTIDIGYRDGSYQQVNNVVSYKPVESGIVSDTVDIEIMYPDYHIETKRIHYVTSIEIIDSRVTRCILTDEEYHQFIK